MERSCPPSIRILRKPKRQPSHGTVPRPKPAGPCLSSFATVAAAFEMVRLDGRTLERGCRRRDQRRWASRGEANDESGMSECECPPPAPKGVRSSALPSIVPGNQSAGGCRAATVMSRTGQEFARNPFSRLPDFIEVPGEEYQPDTILPCGYCALEKASPS